VLDGGGSFEMIDAMKGRLVQSHAERVRRIESGELPVVGVNMFTETAPSPLVSGYEGGEAPSSSSTRPPRPSRSST
jgi:(2R)-ethylmalonyl-CoA mutase